MQPKFTSNNIRLGEKNKIQANNKLNNKPIFINRLYRINKKAFNIKSLT